MNADLESLYFVFTFILILLLGFSVFIVYWLRNRMIIGQPVTNLDYATTFQTSRECSEYSIVDIDWPVSISAGTRVISGVIDNITISNAFVVCQHPLPINSALRLDIHVPNGQMVHTKGQVLWSNAAISNKDTKKRGVGIRFLQLPERDRQVLRSFASDIDNNLYGYKARSQKG